MDALQQAAEKLSVVIPGRREAAGPESSNIGISCFSGFRVRAFGAPRNDRRRVFSAACQIGDGRAAAPVAHSASSRTMSVMS
jgi:hypothetical protein